jgi:hypothetical protein
MATTFQVTFDCVDPDRVATFWAAALGYSKQDPPAGYATWEDFLRERGFPESEWNSRSAVVDPDGAGPRLFFQRVPEPKTVKNRVHLDVNIGGSPLATPLEQRRARIDAEVERLSDVGATTLRIGEERGEYWVVMADPEGNEFCVH